MFDLELGPLPVNAMAKPFDEFPPIDGEKEADAMFAYIGSYLAVQSEILTIEQTYANVDFESVNKDLLFMQVKNCLPERMQGQISIDDFYSMESIKEKFAAVKQSVGAFIKRIWEVIKTFLVGLVNKAEKNYRQAVALREKIAAMKNPKIQPTKVTHALSALVSGFKSSTGMPRNGILETFKILKAYDPADEVKHIVAGIEKELKAGKAAEEVREIMLKGLSKAFGSGYIDGKQRFFYVFDSDANIVYNKMTGVFSFEHFKFLDTQKMDFPLANAAGLEKDAPEAAIVAFEYLRDKALITKLESDIMGLAKAEAPSGGDVQKLATFALSFFKANMQYNTALGQGALAMASLVRDE